MSCSSVRARCASLRRRIRARSSATFSLRRRHGMLRAAAKGNPMSVTEMPKKSAAGPNASAGLLPLEVAAVTRLLVTEDILDYSGHVSARIPGRDAFLIQIGSTSRAEVTAGSMLVCDYDGK